MGYRIPAVVLRGGQSQTPQTTVLTSFANLAPGGSVTLGEFLIDFSPIFDVYVFMDQAGSLQPQIKYAASGSGSAWRNFGAAYVITASVLTGITGLRLPNSRAQFILTQTPAGAATTTLECIVSNRSY